MSRGFAITSEGMKAALNANEVNKIQKKAAQKKITSTTVNSQNIVRD